MYAANRSSQKPRGKAWRIGPSTTTWIREFIQSRFNISFSTIESSVSYAQIVLLTICSCCQHYATILDRHNFSATMTLLWVIEYDKVICDVTLWVYSASYFEFDCRLMSFAQLDWPQLQSIKNNWKIIMWYFWNFGTVSLMMSFPIRYDANVITNKRLFLPFISSSAAGDEIWSISIKKCMKSLEKIVA